MIAVRRRQPDFVKVMDDQILVLRPDGTVDEYFEAFFRAFNRNPALVASADDATFTISGLTADGKATLKKFLSDPNSGKLWEIVPAIVDSEPAVPHNYWIRGILGELDIYKRVYKPAGYTHAPTAAGYDFKLLGPAGEYVQIKTLKNPDGAYNAMRQAVDGLAGLDPPPNGLRLHILKKPGSGGNQLRDQLEAYIESLELERPFILDIDDFELP